MHSVKMALFGGALTAAGLSAQAAPSWDFTDSPYMVGLQAGVLFGGGQAGPDYVSITYLTPGFYGFSTPDGGTAEASISNTDFTISAASSGDGFSSGGNIVAFFTVSAPTLAEWSWSVGGSAGVSGGGILIDEFNDATGRFERVFEASGPTPSVSVDSGTLWLETGVVYAATVSVRDSEGLSGSASFRAIPAPGAVGVLALAGIAAARRRR